MERKKIAFFCWESMYSERVGGLANATTYLAQELARDNEVHFFTEGIVIFPSTVYITMW